MATATNSLLRAPLRAWRWLRTMRTAIILLLVLAAGSIVGSLIPQRPVNDIAVARWKRDHEAWAGIAEWFGLFDVFGSWWFMAIYALLLVSLVGCLVPRYRAFWRAVRSRPRASSALSQFKLYRQGVAQTDQDAALEGAARLLRRKRYRLVRENGTIAGEKGHLREGGSLIFHTAFLVLIVGVALGRGFGFDAQVAVVEGDGFTDTHVAYDSIREGGFFRENHRGFTVRLDDFDAKWFPNGVPQDFVSRITILEGDREVQKARVRVNEPVTYRGVSIYQLAWGWAPRVEVLQKGKLLSEAHVIFLQDSRTQTWQGVVKVPSAKPEQLGLELFFFNDLELGPNDVPFNASPYPRRPMLFYREYRGDLGLDVPQSVYRLDKRRLGAGDAGGIPMGGTATLADDIVVRFSGLKTYSVLQMGSNPGVWVLFAAAVLILVGLLPALYSSRRRVWVRAVPIDGAVRIEVAGHALQRRAAFEDEFAALVRDLGRDLKVVSPASPPGPRVESGVDAG